METMIHSVKGKIVKDIVRKGAYRKFHDRINKRAVLLLQALSDVSNFDDLRRICEPPHFTVTQAKREHERSLVNHDRKALVYYF